MFLALRFFVFAVALIATNAVAASERILTYDIVRNDAIIGNHQVTVSRQDAETRVDIETHIEIESFFITEYAFDFSCKEIWRDGQLIALSSTTTEDGELRSLAVALEGDRYAINAVRENLDRLQRIPASVHPASPWTPTVVEHDKLFDPSTGVVLDVTSKQTDSHTYTISGEWTRTLKYDTQGHLIEMHFPDRTKTDVFFRPQ